MAKPSSLEAQLSALMQEFVVRIVDTLRQSSFGEVARFATARPEAKRSTAPERRRTSTAPRIADAPLPSAPRAGRTRQTADRRAELAERIVETLRASGGPMGVRALSSELGVASDLLAVPLKELRTDGRIAKHGEKRNTTYSAR